MLSLIPSAQDHIQATRAALNASMDRLHGELDDLEAATPRLAPLRKFHCELRYKNSISRFPAFGTSSGQVHLDVLEQVIDEDDLVYSLRVCPA
jgi:hypothetical protein